MNRPPVELVAEFCQNHGGSYDRLARMVEAAAQAGATHGKMQTIFADRIAFRPQFECGLTRDGETLCIRRPYREEFDRLKRLELTWPETRKFVALCLDNGLEPMTTCFARIDAQAIADCGFRSIKVASYDCASFPMLRELASRFSKLYISTGATFDDEIDHAAAMLSGADFTFLHCVTLYPTPIEEMHLARIAWLSRRAPRVGFSDHSLTERDGVLASKAAIRLGASVIERHFTIFAADETRDGPISINPAQMRELACFAQMSPEEQEAALERVLPDWRKMLGQETRMLSLRELLNRDYYRGRFASPRRGQSSPGRLIYNWEETPVN